MKTYKQVLTRVAEQAFSNLMSGSMNSPFYGIDLSQIAFIYEKTPGAVWKDAEKRFKEVDAEARSKWAAHEKAAV